MSPCLRPRVVASPGRPLGTPFADRAGSLMLSVFAASSLGMLCLSFFVEIFFYWNIVAILPLVPLLAVWIRRRRVMVSPSKAPGRRASSVVFRSGIYYSL